MGGKKLDAVWQWREGYWCRTLSSHSKNTDRQLMEISGDQLRGARSRGTSKGFTDMIR
ncbi:hypothetical protein GG681_09040 [Epibacterium sp. SM1969]|uniref:Uncharacterized protein n=1 Tax=Tritonibacter aquimaris TaxID=2663379 RepID=A0A844B061_9RHOB|nr:hypothetical protein [Tritonibacter aquimaris]MQY42786.1 hypothetical protein [Tritonibacter aquimaris]